MRNIIIFLIVFFSACKQPMENRERVNDLIDCENEGFVDVMKWSKEILNVDSLMYKKDIFLSNSIDFYRKTFGHEIQSYPVMHEDVPIFSRENQSKRRYIFHGAIVDEVDGVFAINSVDFSKVDIELHVDSLILKNDSKVAEVCNAYPRSCRLISSGGNMWSGFIELKIDITASDYRRLFLIYQQARLKKMKVVNITN